MSALTEALAAARKELDEHKEEKHNGQYSIGCPDCWRLLLAWDEARQRV